MKGWTNLFSITLFAGTYPEMNDNRYGKKKIKNPANQDFEMAFSTSSHIIGLVYKQNTIKLFFFFKFYVELIINHE